MTRITPAGRQKVVRTLGFRAREMVDVILSEKSTALYIPDAVDKAIRERFKIYL